MSRTLKTMTEVVSNEIFDRIWMMLTKPEEMGMQVIIDRELTEQEVKDMIMNVGEKLTDLSNFMPEG